MCQSMTRSPYHTLSCQVRVQKLFFCFVLRTSNQLFHERRQKIVQ